MAASTPKPGDGGYFIGVRLTLACAAASWTSRIG
jgi:hypothetical protein